MEKKVEFPKGKQKEFLLISREELKLTWPEFAKKLNIKRGTLEKSYRWEYCRLPYNIFLKICKLRNLSKDKLLKNYKTKIINFDPKTIIGRKVLGEIRTKLPEINITFKSSIPSFNTSNIKLNKFDEEKGLKFPDKLTPELAEEIGIHIGDGFLSDKRFEYRLKGNKDEKEYYDFFIKSLFKKLYNISINLKEYETTYGFELASKSFWILKNKILGIKAGRKDNIELPKIIKVNNIKILTSFIRGLFDTDGSVSFIKKYKNLGNYYPVISISLKSKKLVEEVGQILYMLGLEPKLTKNGPYWKINLNGYKRLEIYSKLIGWSNPKHIKKVKSWKKSYPNLGKNVMVGVM